MHLGCGEELSATQRYNLRLANATINGRYPAMDAQVCFRRVASGTPRQCVPYSSASANSDQPGATLSLPVPIFLGDVLTGKGIEVEIWEKGQSSPTAQFTTHHNNLKATALCMGMKLAPPNNSSDTKVYVFLDDP